MPVATTTAILAGGALLGGVASAVSANSAANAQKDAAYAGMQATERARNQARADLQPFTQTGVSANNLQADLYGFNGPEAQARAKAQFQTDPGYQFSFDEGQRAVQGSAAARSSTLSGGTLKALTDYGIGRGNQAYGQWYDRLDALSNRGQSSAAGQANITQQAGRDTANLWGDYGAARAGGALGVGNAITGSLNSALQGYGYTQGYGGGQAGYGGTAKSLFDSGRF